MTNIDYWHNKAVIPEEAKKELRVMVKGELFAQIEPRGELPVNLLRVDSNVFAQVFKFNRKYLYKGDYTAPPEENSYGDDECFLTEDGLAGFSITDDNWLISLYSNQSWRGFLRLVKPFLKRATKLVCIVNGENDELVNAYKNTLGFRIIAHTIDDTKIMTEYYGEDFIDNFVSNYGSPHHVFMYRPISNTDIRDIKSFEDYFEAEKFVNQEVKPELFTV